MRRRKFLAVTMLALLAACSKPTTPDPVLTHGDDRALLVGINEYPGAPLRGCVNDVNNVKEYLIKEQAFPADRIIVLTDKDATRNAIWKKLEWLVADAKAGDRRYFHFSGHGTEFAGRETETQPGGMNQVICPYDFDWTEKTMVMDVEFRDLFKKMPEGVVFNWASDSCHSGDLTRDLGRPEAKPRRYPTTPDDVKARIKKAKELGLKGKGFIGGLLDVGYVSGCKYDQTSADAYEDGEYCGAMTHFLLKTLREMPDKPLVEVVKELNVKLAYKFYTQRPQCEGARFNKPFLK